MPRFSRRNGANLLKVAALLFGCFLAGVMVAAALLDYAETFTPKTFLWTWLFWAGAIVLALASVALGLSWERLGRALR